MDKFISEHMINEEIEVYCGGPDVFKGKIIANADGVLTVETEKGVLTHIAIDKIIAIWRKK